MINSVRPINSTNRFVDAKFVDQPKDYPIEGRTVVINPNLTPVFIGETPVRHIPAFSSTILQNTRIEQAESVLLFQVSDESNMADIVTETDWGLLADLMPGFPRETRLYRGPQEHVGTVEFDPALALGELSTTGPRTFEVKVNLWFAPAGTDCAIHNEHEFIEIHTQIHGHGRMQKFSAPDHATLYEDLLMSPGYTTPVPFCGSRLDGGFTYPWHQYRADSDCVWLAVEYHVT